MSRELPSRRRSEPPGPLPAAPGLVLKVRAALCTAMLLATLGMAMPAAADVYIWIDPKTGKKAMSNFLPSWLRDAQPGQKLPKYEIWRDGKKIDLATALGSPPPPPEPPARSTRSTPGQSGAAPLPPGAPGGPVEPPYNDDD